MKSKAMTIDGKRYTICEWLDGRVTVRGHRVNIAVAGVDSLDSPNLRERVIDAIRLSREAHARASANFQRWMDQEQEPSRTGGLFAPPGGSGGADDVGYHAR